MNDSVFVSLLSTKLRDIGIDDWKVFHYTTVDSTNDEAKRLLEEHENVIVFAEIQTKGRGTHDRIWESPRGGVWITIATRQPHPVMDYSNLVADHLTKVYSDIIDEDCVHKPVNDILLRGRKLAGILVETKIRGSTIQEMVVGVGVNVYNTLPEYLREVGISISEVTAGTSVFEVAQETALEIVLLLRKFLKKV